MAGADYILIKNYLRISSVQEGNAKPRQYEGSACPCFISVVPVHLSLAAGTERLCFARQREFRIHQESHVSECSRN